MMFCEHKQTLQQDNFKKTILNLYKQQKVQKYIIKDRSIKKGQGVKYLPNVFEVMCHS